MLPAIALPAVVSAIVSGLAAAALTIGGRLLIGLGIGVVTYKGFSILLKALLDQIKKLFGTLPIEICGIATSLQVDVCITILFSAYAASLVLSGLTGDTVKKWVTK